MRLEKAYRIITFMPVGEKYIKPADLVKKLNEKFDLSYGAYKDVAYYSTGIEQYEPVGSATPVFGEVGKFTQVESQRLEISVPHDFDLLNKIVEELCTLHPWEEPVVSIYEILETRSKT